MNQSLPAHAAPGYPFSAVVGMDDMRLALVLNAVSPEVGGVLVRGEKGTAKSTMVRALAAILPDLPVVLGCRFSCDPGAPDPACPDGPHGADAPSRHRPARLVELPVGASEDRVVGALDIERALTEGVKAFEPGLLADAHRGVLYVDEVNLLHDHVVDLLLDAAALGRSYVEREGVSVRHAARFLLVGTMNPEEGELRPQLLDRFGLTVEVAAPRDVPARAEVVRRRIAFDDDPARFAARWEDVEAELAGGIAAARGRLADVVLTDAALEQIASVCAAFEVDGMRADLVTARAATAHAAWVGRSSVTAEDVRIAARLALPHRRRRNPFDAPDLDDQRLEDALSQAADQSPADNPESDGPEDPGPDRGGSGGAAPESPTPPDSAGGADPDRRAEGNSPPAGPRPSTTDSAAEGPVDPSAGDNDNDNGSGNGGGGSDRTAAPGQTFRARRLEVPGAGAGAAGRRSRAETGTGRSTGARRPTGRATRLSVPATLMAAAPHQVARGRRGGGLVLRTDDLRESRREGRESNLLVFCVDASGSMAARTRMSVVKAAVLSLLLDAYQRRDKVGVVTFRRDFAEVALPPTSSVEAGAARLATMPTGGRTPLAAGLYRAAELIRVERLRDPLRRPLLVVVTDGRATGGPEPRVAARHAAAAIRRAGTATVVVDCESGPIRLGLAGALAADLGGDCVALGELAEGGLAGVVQDVRGAA